MEESRSLALITPRNREVRDTSLALRVLGIDLGTTNCSVAEIVLHAGDTNLPEARALEISQPTTQGEFIHTLVPSIIALHRGKVYVGEGAKQLRPQMTVHELEENVSVFWECKNEIGTRRTYHRAPAGYNTPRDISRRILQFLLDSTTLDESIPVSSAVVTIPASFQTAQRNDTERAATAAGLKIADSGGLLDEPVAAYIAYMVQSGHRVADDLHEEKNLLVFDFGGGTCDVALFRLMPPKAGKPIDIVPLAVSRYCRLGGGDIDRAIVIHVLIPQLLRQNALTNESLNFEAKDRFVIPALLGVAETLKIKLCEEYARQLAMGLSPEESLSDPVSLAGSYRCRLKDGTEYVLSTPTLSVNEFSEALEPFLDIYTMIPQESEYHTTCSIFAPITDAIEQAGLYDEDIDQCLLVGGSTLIPQIRQALKDYLPNAEFLSFDTPAEMETAVSAGAAYQALSLAIYGSGVFKTVVGDDISIRTKNGTRTLIQRGEEVPYPVEGWLENRDLTVPKTALTEPLDLRVELCNAVEKTLYKEQWTINSVVNQGEPILLRYRVDANQLVQLELSLVNQPDYRPFKGEIENPLTNVVNVNTKRERVLALEESMRTGDLDVEQQIDIVIEIADLEQQLGRRERALQLLHESGRRVKDTSMLFKLARVYGEIGDHEQEQEYYLRTVKNEPNNSAAFFNIALSQRSQGKNRQALVNVEKTIEITPDGPSYTLKALIEEKLGNQSSSEQALDRAFDLFEPTRLQKDWELYWYGTAAKLASDDVRLKDYEEELRSRNQSINKADTGLLPLDSPRTAVSEMS